VTCLRCATTAPPAAKHRCSNCGVFLPGNPGNPKPPRDDLDDWEAQLITDLGGPDHISPADRTRIEATVTAHRVVRRATDQLRRSVDPKEALNLLKLLSELPPSNPGGRDNAMPGLRRTPTPVIVDALRLEARRVAGEKLTPRELGRLDAWNELLDGSVIAETPAPALPPEPPQAEHDTVPGPLASSPAAALPSTRPDLETPASAPQADRPRTIGECQPHELDDATRIALYGETPADIEARRKRATAEMLANLGKESSWLK
jgi:hypothetical protein